MSKEMSKNTNLEDLKINLQLFADQDHNGANAEPGADDKGTGGEGNSQADQNNVNDDNKDDVLTKEAVEKMIQSATDKVRTEYVKKLKILEAEKEELEKAKMTEEEKRAFEEEKRQKELEAKEQEIRQKELNIKAYDVIVEQELNPKLKPFILADTEEDIETKAKELKSIINNIVETALQEKIKGLGREPHKGGEPAGDDNPFKKILLGK